jgi:hypothetical protein
MSLSEGARQRLCQYLPQTAFEKYEEILDESHPSLMNTLKLNKADSEKMDVDEVEGSSSSNQHEDLDLSVFTEPHFESAIQSFQVSS